MIHFINSHRSTSITNPTKLPCAYVYILSNNKRGGGDCSMWGGGVGSSRGMGVPGGDECSRPGGMGVPGG